MGSDDVRARAEAVARGLFTNGAPRRYAYLVLRDTPGNLPGEGGSWSERAVADRIAAALAVAPATAQPGACPVCKGSGKRGRMSFVDPSKDIVSSCDVCRGSGTLAAPPATGDAAAVREACARLCESFKEHLWSGAAAPGTHAGSVATLLAGAIRRIPLPAPATAVEEALPLLREARRFMERLRQDRVEQGIATPVLDAHLAKVDALLAAEAKAAATHAAKESRSDDRPASGQGGV